MNETLPNSESQAASYLEKAETYKKLGLKAQVQYEMEQAKGIDPYIVHEPRYKALIEADTAELQKKEALKTPLRIGAGMLLVNAVINVIFLIIIISVGGAADMEGSDIISPIADVVIAINLWQLKEQWKRNTVWWAVIGLVIFGLGALVSSDYFGFIIQVGFSGSLILLLAGTPSKARTITAVAVFLVVYLGAICLIFALSALGALAG